MVENAENKYQFDGRFTNNILTVGHTSCGKTIFVQNLAKNKIFREIKTNDWVSKIKLSEKREEDIRHCLEGTKVHLHYLKYLSSFNVLIEDFQRENIVNDDDLNEVILGEKRKFNRLIVMDDVSGLADRSNKFSSFLTVSRKFGYIHVYFFHIIFPKKLIWQMILFQTKIFNVFPSAIQFGNMLKILTNNCDSETINYILSRDLSINRLYLSI